ncbi:unnamed protein product [Ixodes pacificus]
MTQVPAATVVEPRTQDPTVLLGSLCATFARRATSWTSVAFANESKASWRLHLHAILEAEKAKAKYVEVTVDNYTAIFKVDPSAEVSVASESLPELTSSPGKGRRPADGTGRPVAKSHWVRHGYPPVARQDLSSACVRDQVPLRAAAGAPSRPGSKCGKVLGRDENTGTAESFQGSRHAQGRVQDPATPRYGSL